jgi:hypothetical protein
MTGKSMTGSTTTVLFIHGTGVREPEFTRTFNRIKRGLRPGLSFRPCFWGAQTGATLQANGSSFYFDPARSRSKRSARDNRQDPGEERELALWERLYADPLFEIRIREISQPPDGGPGEFLEDRVRSLPENAQLAAELDSLGLIGAFAQAVRGVTESAEFTRVFYRSTTTDGNTMQMLARALVAYCLSSSAGGGLVAGDNRDRLVATVAAAFAVPDQGIADDLKGWATDTAWWAANPWVRNGRRGAIEQFADIVLYQAHGDKIREWVRNDIGGITGDVVLLAHSLGGVIAFDLLAGQDKSGLDRVSMLVTVGSQVPLFYELGALTCGVNFPVMLSEAFKPDWLNVYDKRDLLAYAGGELFSKRCTDIMVNTKDPFPSAHNAYWDTEDFYLQLDAGMRARDL